jgi:hypothetical protein
MIRALHTNDILTLRQLSGHFDRGFYCFGSRIPEEKGIKGGVRHNWDQAFNKSEIWLMQSDAALFTVKMKFNLKSGSQYLRVNKLHALVRRGFANLWVRVPWVERNELASFDVSNE